MKVKEVTPSGVRLLYQDEPKRLYTVNDEWVPSVTEVLGVLDKPALVWWGMTIGVAGVLKLWRDGEIFHDNTDEAVVSALTEHRLTVNHVRDEAGKRGTSAHAAFEIWAETGLLPSPDDYPERDRGYVAGLLAFLEEAAPMPIASEVMVGSPEYEYAGRYDLEAQQDEREVVVRASPKRTRRGIIPPGDYLYDLKTSKGVYDTHALQLSAYEGARRECGYKPTQHRAVVRVASDGRYEVVLTKPCYPQFLAVREAHRAMQFFKKGK